MKYIIVWLCSVFSEIQWTSAGNVHCGTGCEISGFITTIKSVYLTIRGRDQHMELALLNPQYMQKMRINPHQLFLERFLGMEVPDFEY